LREFASGCAETPKTPETREFTSDGAKCRGAMTGELAAFAGKEEMLAE
jgi:hypothetical protein